MISDAQIQLIKEALSPYAPERLGVFGSYAKNLETVESDLDVLVRFGKQLSLLDIIEIEQQLSELLGIKVDLITENALSPHIRPYVEAEYVDLLA